jgi:DNA-binding MarR family transcriptional regulator
MQADSPGSALGEDAAAILLRSQMTAKHVMDVLPPVMGIIRSEMRLAAKGVFTIPQFRALNRISKQPQTNRELAEWMGVAPPTMSRMIDSLVKKGYLEKTRDSSDLRQQTLALTQQGRQEMSRVRTAVHKKIALKFKSLSGTDCESLMRGLDALREAFH